MRVWKVYSTFNMKLYHRNFKLFFVYCVAVHVFERVCCNTLPGSCIAAGHTTCCNSKVDNCAGDTEVCFCDPICQEYHDCCADLSSICPDISTSQRSSILLLPSNVTYRSATIRWVSLVAQSSPGSGVGADDSDFITSINTARYTISYYTKDNVSDIATVSMVGNSAELHSALLVGLKPHTCYFYFVTANSELDVVDSRVDTFTTLDYPKIQQVKLEVVNPSTVRLSWAAVQLPLTVQVLRYAIYYEQNGIELSQELSASYNHGEIAGLRAGTYYRFSLSVSITDVDGSVFEGNRSSDATVFIPETSLFQLKAGPFQACNHWNEATEEAAIEALHSGTLQAITNYCNCQYPSKNIYKELVVCEVDRSTKTDTPTAHAIYRGNILSTPNLTTNELLTVLQRWALNAPLLRTQLPRSKISVDSTCPVSISRMSEPLCSTSCSGCSGMVTEEISQSFNNGSDVSPMDKCISLPIFIAALLAELLLCAIIMMVGVVIALLSSRSSKRKESATQLECHERRPAVSNFYTAGPINGSTGSDEHQEHSSEAVATPSVDIELHS